jgi:hypothetical protein
LAPAFALLFQALSPDIFFFSNKTKEKKKHKEKKNHREDHKIAEKGGSLPSFSHFCIWDEALFLLSPLHILSTLSSPLSTSLVSTSL